MTGPYVSVKKVWNRVDPNEIKKRQPERRREGKEGKGKEEKRIEKG